MDVKRFPYGGQAVLEGVMMRGLRQATTAVRGPQGEIVFKHEQLDVRRRHLWETLPFLRGVLGLWDALVTGTRALNFSASVAMQEEQQDQKDQKGAELGTTLAMLISLALAVGFFFMLPALVAGGFQTAFGASNFARETVDAVVQMCLFIGYLALISRLPDIQRVFGYHGAEHKTINAYEAGAPLTVESVRSFTVIHPRCGTSFLLVVMILSIPIFLLVSDLPLWARLLARLPLIPLIAAISYELLRLSAANYQRAWVRVLVGPSLALQRLTTREPDDAMIAVAIAALLPVLAADGVKLDTYDETLALGLPAAV